MLKRHGLSEGSQFVGLPGIALSEIVCILLSVLTTIVSIVKLPAIPVNDPAFYEWGGWAMTHGERLYTDFTDQKLPSIFLVNALWQWLFPTNYQIHAWLEGTINLIAFSIFALLMRKNSIAGWAPATLLFALVYSLPFPQFNYPEHYAVLFIILAFCLVFCKRNLLGGASLAIAATFWPPAALMLVPPLTLRIPSDKKIAFMGGFVGLCVASLIVPMLFFGPAWFVKPISNAMGGLSGLDFVQLHITFFEAALGPAILALLLLLWLVAHEVETEAQAFGLWWSLVALMGTAIPPKFSEHYFLPSVPALVMAIGSFGCSRPVWRARPLVAFLLAITVFVTMRNTITVTSAALSYGRSVQELGNWMVSTLGPGHILWTNEYVPELFLATLSIQAGPLTIHGQQAGFGGDDRTDLAVAKDAWLHYPQIVVYGPYKPLRQPALHLLDWSLLGGPSYVPVCAERLAGSPFALYATADLVRRLACPTDLVP